MMEERNAMNVLTRANRRQKGVSLIELLIGITVGLIILAGALALFSSMLKSSKTNLAMTNLDQELRAAMDIMVRNIRRAGYYGRTPTDGTDLSQYGPTNPFQIGGYEMTLGGTPYGDTCNSNGECPCISFSYDGDGDGSVAGTSDIFGFRYDRDHDAIEMRNFSSGVPNCSMETGWVDITDDSVVVDSLTFRYENRDANTKTEPLALNITFPVYNLESACNTSATCACKSDYPPCASCPCGCPDPANAATDEECLQMRTVIVTIDAHRCQSADPSGQCKKEDKETTMSIRERVKVPNDRFCTEDNNPPDHPQC
jgi:prepilin peptidase dependent protein B